MNCKRKPSHLHLCKVEESMGSFLCLHRKIICIENRSIVRNHSHNQASSFAHGTWQVGIGDIHASFPYISAFHIQAMQSFHFFKLKYASLKKVGLLPIFFPLSLQLINKTCFLRGILDYYYHREKIFILCYYFERLPRTPHLQNNKEL